MASGYKQVRVEEAPLPGAVYACSNGVCALEVSYPAELLCWFDGLPAAEDDVREGPWPPDEVPKPGWYCTEACWTEIPVLAELWPENTGPSMAAVLRSRV